MPRSPIVATRGILRYVPDPTDPTPVEAALRKQPAQQRSMERVEHILDAAGELVSERGYAGITTSLIARRAKVPPGTLYEFFADKRAVVQAAAARNLERFGRRVAAAMGEHPPEDLRAAAALMLDLYVDMSRADRGFRAVRFGDVVDTHLLDPAADNDALAAARFATMLSREIDVADTPDLRRTLVLAIKIVDVLVGYAFEVDPSGDPWVLARTRLLIDHHLAQLP
jgi:AcrR family transcriptional regulator